MPGDRRKNGIVVSANDAEREPARLGAEERLVAEVVADLLEREQRLTLALEKPHEDTRSGDIYHEKNVLVAEPILAARLDH